MIMMTDSRDLVAKKIRELLAKRHIDDVYYEEVIIANGRRRMDAWAMKKSWANPLVIAYEIKSSRADFLADNKMQEYMPFCNTAYVVCPKDACTKDEIPEGFGLIYVSSNGTQLRTIKKAAYRDCTLSEEFLRALLFSKADSYASSFGWVGEEIASRVGVANNFENYLAGRKKLRDLGYGIAESLKRRERELLKLEEKKEDIMKQHKTFESFFKLVYEKYGWYFNSNFQRAIEKEDAQAVLELFESFLPPPYETMVDRMKSLQQDMKEFLEKQGRAED